MKKINTIQEFVKFIHENKLSLKTTKEGGHPFFKDCTGVIKGTMSVKEAEVVYGVEIEGLESISLSECWKWYNK